MAIIRARRTPPTVPAEEPPSSSSTSWTDGSAAGSEEISLGSGSGADSGVVEVGVVVVVIVVVVLAVFVLVDLGVAGRVRAVGLGVITVVEGGVVVLERTLTWMFACSLSPEPLLPANT